MHACRSRVTIFWRWCGVFAAVASLSAAAPRPAAGVARVVIISVDGLRPDLLLRGRTPAIANLMQHGSYTLAARTIVEGYTVPSHVSMLTGVVPSRHALVEGLSVDTMATLATACALLGIEVPGTIDGKNVPDILSVATQPR